MTERKVKQSEAHELDRVIEREANRAKTTQEAVQIRAAGSMHKAVERVMEEIASGKLDVTHLPEDVYQRQPAQLVQFLAERHLTQRLMYIGMGMSHEAAKQCANDQWREAMPELHDRLSVLQFLALVAWGLRNRVLDGAEAKMLIFLAQTHLSVLKAGARPGAGAAAPAPKAPPSGSLFTGQEMTGGFVDPEKGGKR